MFRRLPFSIKLSIETSFREPYFSNVLQTYLQTDESLNMLLVGMATNSTGLVEPLKIENSHIISCCLRLGGRSVDNYGREVGEDYWSRCDYNDRRNTQAQGNGTFVVEKAGVAFHFAADNASELLYLTAIAYRVEVLPKTLAKKSIPVHLFGELARTEMGVAMIESHSVLQTFVHEIRNPESTLLNKRASLWGVAHIGSSETGLRLVLSSDILPSLIALAETSECLSLRGTSLYALGLISKTVAGKRALAKYGWLSHPQPGSIVCLPKNMRSFFTIAPIEYKGDFTKHRELWEFFEETLCNYNFPEESQRALKYIGNLSNHVTQKDALPELRKMAQKSPDIFLDVEVFHCVVMILTNYSFKLQVRRWIFQLFDRLLSLPDFLEKYIEVTDKLNNDVWI